MNGESTSASPGTRRGSLGGRIFRGAFVGASLAFVGVALVRAWDDLSAALRQGPWWLVMLAVGLALATMLWTAGVWLIVLRALGGWLPRGRGFGIFFVGESAKYLPGALWSVVGRGELAARHGVDRGPAYASVLLSMGLNYVIAAAAACVALVPLVVATSSAANLSTFWVVLVLPVGIALLHPRVVGPVLDVARRVVRRDLGFHPLPWLDMIRLSSWYLPVWFLAGLTSVAAVELVGGDAPVVRTIFAACLAWLVGFLVVPVPSGLGVREGVFAAVMSSDLTSSQALAAALLARVAFIVADSLGALAGLLLLRVGSGRSQS